MLKGADEKFNFWRQDVVETRYASGTANSDCILKFMTSQKLGAKDNFSPIALSKTATASYPDL